MRSTRNTSRWVAALLSASLAACGGGSGTDATGAASAAAATAAAAVAPAPAPAPAAAPPAPYTTSYAALKAVGLVPQAIPEPFDLARTYLDVDGDGIVEVFSASLRYDASRSTPTTAAPSHFAFYRRQPDGRFIEAAALLPEGSAGCIHPRKAVLGDFNGDGRLDVFVACHGFDAAPFPGERNKVVLSRADGSYTIRDASTSVGFFHGAAAADFDRDGRIDVVVTDNMSNPSVRVWLGDGRGGFTPSAGLLPPALAVQAGFFTVDLPDIDGDGRFDLFVAGHEWEGGAPTVFLNPGSNDFGSAVGRTLPAVPSEGVVLDITVTGPADARSVWLLRTSGGDGTFYQSATVQKVGWPGLASSVPLQRRGAQWQPWMIPTTRGGQPLLVSDDLSATILSLPY
jgi:hypothetical protein